MWDALREVRLEGYLLSQQGLDTPLSERGENLSGGQRQRLAIARSLLRDTPVYLFDEAASNIDSESEEKIMEAIRRLSAFDLAPPEKRGAGGLHLSDGGRENRGERKS